jgi:hypothetical protein
METGARPTGQGQVPLIGLSSPDPVADDQFALVATLAGQCYLHALRWTERTWPKTERASGAGTGYNSWRKRRLIAKVRWLDGTVTFRMVEPGGVGDDGRYVVCRVTLGPPTKITRVVTTVGPQRPV